MPDFLTGFKVGGAFTLDPDKKAKNALKFEHLKRVILLEPSACGKPGKALKLHLNGTDVRYSFTSYGSDHVVVNGEPMGHGLIVSTSLLDRESFAHVRFEDLAEQHFSRLSGLGSEIILLGTGARLRFPHPSLTRPLIDARIGLEVMDTGAACRTYNILASEGRKVLAVILAWETL